MATAPKLQQQSGFIMPEIAPSPRVPASPPPGAAARAIPPSAPEPVVSAVVTATLPAPVSPVARPAATRQRRDRGKPVTEKRGRQGEGGGRPAIYEIPLEKKTVQLTPGLQEKLKTEITAYSRRTGAVGIGPSTIYNGAGAAVLETGFLESVGAQTPREVQAALSAALRAYVEGQGRR